MDTFVSKVLETPMDIEDLVTQGTRRAVCPYYGARSAVPYADIVVVPYNCLIHKCAPLCLGFQENVNVPLAPRCHCMDQPCCGIDDLDSLFAVCAVTQCKL